MPALDLEFPTMPLPPAPGMALPFRLARAAYLGRQPAAADAPARRRERLVEALG